MTDGDLAPVLVTYADMPDLLRRYQPFQGTSVAAATNGAGCYTVTSYGRLVAWVDPKSGHWHVDTTFVSKTTSRAQAVLLDVWDHDLRLGSSQDVYRTIISNIEKEVSE